MCDHELVNEGDLLFASSAKRFFKEIQSMIIGGLKT
jgi:hypothetical protein